MKTAGYVAFFVVVFLSALVLRFPLGFLLQQAGKSGALEYEHASGTVWRGEVTGLVVGQQPLGDVTLQMRPGEIVTGRLAYDFTMRGEVADGKGVGSIGWDGGVRLANVIADVDIQKLERLDARLRAQPATMNIAIREAEWNRSGQCLKLKGDLASDILTVVGRSYSWNGPGLSGEFKCQDKASVVEVTGAASPDRIVASGSFSGNGAYEVSAQVSTTNETLGTILQSLEFTPANGAFVYEKSTANTTGSGDENA